ncbi:MAG TPA: hypothetical protein VL970_10720 [Candidatus Acidoferrales bacterium]|nr:hypothetical protein [Candidatus Acidoferrales bacterium]
MNDSSEDFAEKSAVFQKIWLESMSKLMKSAFAFPPNSTPPELLREIRDGILRALGESWNEFMRSPQFQESMKQWMENAVAFRQMSNDFMAKVRKEMQAPTREDIDAIQQNLRHSETRVLDRLEALAKQIEALNQRTGAPKTATRKPAGPAGPRGRARPRTKKADTL